jgi:hypothetical protein
MDPALGSMTQKKNGLRFGEIGRSDTKVFGSGLNGDGFCWMGIYADG